MVQGNSGGFVSPSGLSFIGRLTTGERLLSVQRIILDEKIAYAAETAGATLVDGFTVKVRAMPLHFPWVTGLTCPKVCKMEFRG